MSYWQKRDAAKDAIGRGLRRHLIAQYLGLPVLVLRNRADQIRADNKAWVKDTLKHFDCDDFKVSWTVSFEFKLDESGTAVVSDFTVLVEGT